MNRRQLLTIAAGSFALKGQEFEAASIKPSAPMGQGRVLMSVELLPGGRISMSGVTVKVMIQRAYGVRDFQIVGGPAWLGLDRYDVVAKPEGAATPDQVNLMMQALLKDRFQLKFHRETKELSAYALVIAKGGPKLKESVVASDGPDRGGQMRMRGGSHFEANGRPVSTLAAQLSNSLGRAVIDKTGLTGNYDFKLDWTPDVDGPAPADSAGPSIFTAVQDQLGLKLESTKGPVEILVIDRAEKASEN